MPTLIAEQVSAELEFGPQGGWRVWSSRPRGGSELGFCVPPSFSRLSQWKDELGASLQAGGECQCCLVQFGSHLGGNHQVAMAQDGIEPIPPIWGCYDNFGFY